jgi:hypothetical protein
MACHLRYNVFGNSSEIANKREAPQYIAVFWFEKPGCGKISGDNG